MKRLFADTFFFYAFLNADDSTHHEAVDYYESFKGELVTTEWVLVELGDGFSRIANRELFVSFHDTLRKHAAIKVIPADGDLFAAGMQLFAARPDKEWSLTDCISFVTMQREGLEEALTGDHHFEQAGFRALLKN